MNFLLKILEFSLKVGGVPPPLRVGTLQKMKAFQQICLIVLFLPLMKSLEFKQLKLFISLFYIAAIYVDFIPFKIMLICWKYTISSFNQHLWLLLTLSAHIFCYTELYFYSTVNFEAFCMLIYLSNSLNIYTVLHPIPWIEWI